MVSCGSCRRCHALLLVKRRAAKSDPATARHADLTACIRITAQQHPLSVGPLMAAQCVSLPFVCRTKPRFQTFPLMTPSCSGCSGTAFTAGAPLCLLTASPVWVDTADAESSQLACSFWDAYARPALQPTTVCAPCTKSSASPPPRTSKNERRTPSLPLQVPSSRAQGADAVDCGAGRREQPAVPRHAARV